MAYEYENDPRVPDWKPDERNEVYLRVKPNDRTYTEKLIPLPAKLYDSDSRTLNEMIFQVKRTFSDAKVTLIQSFPKKGRGFISHPHLLIDARIEDLNDLKNKLNKYK